MAETLSILLTRAKIRSRMNSAIANVISDSDFVTYFVPQILTECWDKMVEVESNYVYSSGSITTVDGTGEYDIESNLDELFDSVMEEGVWVDGETVFLKEMTEDEAMYYDVDNSTGPPEGFYTTEDGKFGILPVPDDEYTIKVQFWKSPNFVPSGGPLASSVWWRGVWDKYMQARMEYELLGLYEKDVSKIAMELVSHEAEAMRRVRNYGCRIRKRIRKSNFFSVPGV